ncbi:MAG: magnetosome biogenesis CDF transporter MamM [SAR324 cluster bacterium]|nr:magnetosome biogenesis CDF transporter MamM [SAR324 cluster bacterium]
MYHSNCSVCHKTVGWTGLVANILLSVLKLFVGLVSGSQALVADAMYSAKDLVTSIFVIVGLKVSSKPIDKNHMYGHGKIEFFISLMTSIIFLGLTGVIFVIALGHLVEGTRAVPHVIAFVTALFSILVNLHLYKYTSCVTKQVNSPMIETLSKHHHADMMGSAAVAVGFVGGHYLGLPWLDPLVAIFETLHLLYLGGEIFWDSVKGLMDSSAPKEIREKITEKALEVNEVKVVEELKTRRIGQGLWIDIGVGLDPNLSIEEASDVSAKVESSIAEAIEHIASINVRFESFGGLPRIEGLLEGRLQQ